MLLVFQLAIWNIIILYLIYRRVRSGAVDAHPTETAIVVNYELDAFVLGENGEPVIGDHKVCLIFNTNFSCLFKLILC